MPPWTITSATRSHSEQLLNLVCNEFCINSPLHQAVNVSAKEYRDFLANNWDNYLFAGPVPSLVAVDSEATILGCIIPAPFPSNFGELNLLPAKQQPIISLLSTLEAQYLKQNSQPAKSLLVDIAVVRRSAANSGIYKELRQTLEFNAAQAGFEKVFGALSSSATQKVCIEKFKHKVVAEIIYTDFTFKTSIPFATITEPHSIKLVEGRLGKAVTPVISAAEKSKQ